MIIAPIYWNKLDNYMMSLHYSVFDDIINKPPIYEAYTVTFVEQLIFQSLDACEDKWLNNLNIQINIQSMILPRVK